MLNLQKGSPVELQNASGTSVTKMYVGCGWDVATGGKKGLVGKFNKFKGVDLDLGAVALDGKAQPLAACGFETADIFGGALHHTGDNKTGRGDGDDESIIVDLGKLPAQVETVLFSIASFKGATFAKVGAVNYRIVDRSGDGEDELANVYIPITGAHNAALLARVTRKGAAWTVETLGQMGTGKHWRELTRLL